MSQNFGVNMMPRLKLIPIIELKEPLLKTVSNDLYQSIMKYGVLTPILVKEDGTILDGRQRYNATKILGRRRIPCYIVKANEFLPQPIKQIETNSIEYAKQLQKLIDTHPELTLDQIAEKLGKTAEWVKKKLNKG